MARQLVVLGDSLTFGYYATTPAQSYAALVGAALGLEVVNLGQPGKTAVEIAAEYAAGTIPAISRFVDVFILEVGTNDVVAPDEQLTDFRAAYLLLQHLIIRGKRLCLGTWRDSSDPIASCFDNTLAGACVGRYLPLSDLYANPSYHGPEGRSTWLGAGDWFHPNDAGHAAIAARILSAFN